ncbi:MAG: DegV family protein [Candidatus Cryosericum sp.]|nr:DegV family protein [bacterium]
MALHIVTDSTSSLPNGFAERHDLQVVWLKVSVNGVFFREFVEISPETFYAKQRAGAKVGTTQPSPEEFIKIYSELLADPEDEVLSLHLSAALSGTLNSAYIAAEQTDPGRVHLYDVRTTGPGFGLMVMSAVKMAERGASVRDVIHMLDGMQSRTHTYFLVGTMKYLIEGGRVGKAAGVAASILQIKPILTVRDGIIDVYERPRTIRAAHDRLWAIVDQAVVQGIEHIGFYYTGNRPEVEAMQTTFTKRTGIPSVLGQLGPDLGCHTGPDTVGIVILDSLSRAN